MSRVRSRGSAGRELARARRGQSAVNPRYAVGAGLTTAALALSVWLALLAVERPHPLSVGLAALFFLAALATLALMWRELTRPGARPRTAVAGPIRCPRCGQDHIRPQPDGRLTGLLARVGAGLYNCQLCSKRFLARAGASAAWTAADLRLHMRLPANVPIRCLTPGGMVDAVITDISMGGCRLETDAAVADGAVLYLELGAAEQGHPFAVEARVVRAAGPHAFALRFTPPDGRPDRERLRWFVQRLLAHRPSR